MTEPYLIPQNELPEKYVAIHTTDRNLFRRCRRKWHFESELGKHLVEKDKLNENLWFGTGFHFALEDYHGFNRFRHPAKAFDAYLKAFKLEQLSIECQALAKLAPHMFDYYINDWLPQRNEFETFFVDKIPQVEVEFSIYIPELSDWLGLPVIYQGKLDRIVTDIDGMLWFMDYKTAGKFDVEKLETDPQISSYSWAFPFIYNKLAEGIVYLQFRKAIAEPPKILKNGDISSDKRQNTTYKLYLEALQSRYGQAYPEKNREMLDILINQETPEGDNFIRFDKVKRNEHNRRSEYQKILAEGYEMLNSKISLYPNPNRDCKWDCNFRSVCLAMDDGSDWEFMLNENFEKKKNEEELWLNKAHQQLVK